MDFFEYRRDELFAENVEIAQIAEQVGTPFYLYSSASMKHQFEQLKNAFGSLDLCSSSKSIFKIFSIK